MWLIPGKAFAFPVDELPEDNLINNPWFRSGGDDSGLDGWTDAGGPNKYWSSSQKASNPTADQIMAGPCGSQELFCGTAARLDPTMGKSGGLGIPGIDSYLYQVIEADQADRKYVFFAHWVSHQIEVAEVSIYGADSPDGPFELVWVPFYHTQDTTIRSASGRGQEDLWEKTGFVETVVEKGYPFYKIEIHARLPEGNSTGFKITGVYFSTSQTDEPPSGNLIVTQVPIDSPEPNVVGETGEPIEPVWTAAVEETVEPVTPSSVEETNINSGRATRAARRTQMAQESPAQTEISTTVPASTPAPLTTAVQATPVPVVPTISGNSSGSSGFPEGFLVGGLLVFILFAGIFLTRFLFKR